MIIKIDYDEKTRNVEMTFPKQIGYVELRDLLLTSLDRIDLAQKEGVFGPLKRKYVKKKKQE